MPKPLDFLPHYVSLRLVHCEPAIADNEKTTNSVKRNMETKDISVTDEILDVAIVGGGISGVYSGWRLINSDPSKSEILRAWADKRPNNKLKISIFERSDRIGGRLLSVIPPGMPSLRAELGGMRFLSTHTLIRSLVENHLHLKTYDFPVSNPQNILYLRGTHLHEADLSESKKVPYNMNWQEKGKSAGNLISQTIEQIIPDALKIPHSDWREKKQTVEFDGKKLYQQGFWNVLSRVISTEAYEFVRQAGGYETTLSNWNAADAIPWYLADFGPQTKYIGLRDGFESVPLKLRDKFVEMGGDLQMNHELKSFQQVTLSDESRGIQLRFKNGLTINCRRLILAMPRRSLELIDQTGPVLDPANVEVHKMIRSVTPQPLLKIFLCYQNPWWQVTGINTGKSNTDLPVRQCYYFGTEGDQPGADKNNRNSLMMASYHDGSSRNFWIGMLKEEQESADLKFFLPNNQFSFHSPDLNDQRWRQYLPPAVIVDELQRQLREIHNLEYIPDPYDAAYMDWGTDPYGGGYNLWKIHAKSWEIIPKMIQPVPEVPVYICGEAYSEDQGWVEGALQTAELMLQNHFQLYSPEWLL